MSVHPKFPHIEKLEIRELQQTVDRGLNKTIIKKKKAGEIENAKRMTTTKRIGEHDDVSGIKMVIAKIQLLQTWKRRKDNRQGRGNGKTEEIMPTA